MSYPLKFTYPPKGESPKGIYQAFTNLVTDLATTGGNSGVTSSIIGSLNGQDIVQLVSTVNGAEAFRQSNAFVSTSIDGVFLIIGRKGSEEDTKIVFRNVTDSTDDEIIRVVYATKTVTTDQTGEVLKTNWLDDDTFQVWVYINNAIIGKTYNFRYSMNSQDAQNTIGATQSWSAPMYIETANKTMFPFVDGTHAADVIDETFTMPDKFAVRLKVDPKFAYDTSGNKYMFTWYILGNVRLALLYAFTPDQYQLLWVDGGTARDMRSQTFDDGTSLTNLNQELDIIAFLDLSSGGINDSMLIVIPQESGSIFTDNSWGGTPNVKSSDFPTMSQGWNGISGNQADSEIISSQVWSWDGVKPTITSSADADEYFASLLRIDDDREIQTKLSTDFQGDVLLTSTDDGGEIIETNGIIEATAGFETAAFISLFGGNKNDDGTESTKPQAWWGNLTDPDNPERWMTSRTQNILTGFPATPGNLNKIIEAANLDLAWFKSEKIADTIEISASIPARNKLQLDIIILKDQKKLTELRYEENWLGQSAGLIV